MDFKYKDAGILNMINDTELSMINIETLESISGLSYLNLKPILRRLVRDEQLYSLGGGFYCIRNFRNPYVIGNFIVKNGAIAYWSALNLHGLTEQIPNVIYVQSEFRKSDKRIINIQYKFIKVNVDKITGIETYGYGNEQFRITNIEKTLLDCFDLPQHSGGYEELIRAFYNAKTSSLRLLDYGKKMGNLSVLKRMAFLSELYEMKGFSRFQNGVLKLMNKKYSLLDPMGENTGEFNSKWRIRINLSKENLLEMIQKTY